MYGWCLAISCLLSAEAQQAQAENLQTTVTSLVRQLNDKQPAKRDEAEKRLIELGPQILDFLPPVDKQTSAGVAVRLDRIAEKLQTEAAEAITRASRVTLEGEMPLSQALQLLEKQTGNKVVGAERYGDAAVKAAFQKTTYWAALDQLLDQAGLTINPYGGAAGALTVAGKPEGQAPRHGSADYGGVFRFEAVLVEAVRDLRVPAAQRLMVRLEISWEPRITPIAMAQPLTFLTVLDEHDNEVPVQRPEAVCTAVVHRNIPAVELDLPLQLPDRTVKRIPSLEGPLKALVPSQSVNKIASLKGSLRALLPGRIETFQFSDLEKARDVQQRKAAVTVTLQQVRKNVDVHQVLMRVRFDDPVEGFESQRGWMYENEAYLLDPNGKRIENAGAEVISQSPDELGFSYQFVLEDGPAGYKFVYRTPVRIVQSNVAYELKDIQLP